MNPEELKVIEAARKWWEAKTAASRAKGGGTFAMKVHLLAARDELEAATKALVESEK